MKTKTVKYFCDICKKEHERKQLKEISAPVMMSCSQDDGMSCKPYITVLILDLCNECLNKVTVIDYGFREVRRLRREVVE